MKGDTSRRDAGMTGVQQDCPGKPGHLGALGIRVAPGWRCWHVHARLWRAACPIPGGQWGLGAVCSGVLLAPSGSPCSLPDTHARSCQNPGSLCSPSLESSLLILPPMLHIPLGASKNVFCGSEPSNLPLQSAPTPSLCLRASASGCKTLTVKTYVLESSALNPGPGVWGEGAGVTQSVLAERQGTFVIYSH